MGKKLEGNGMWESSRMMLPEHKEELIRHRSQLGRKVRPALDEQRLQDIAYAIGEAVSTGSEVTVTVFGEYVDTEVRGLIKKVDQQLRRVKIETTPDEWEWVRFDDIIGVGGGD